MFLPQAFDKLAHQGSRESESRDGSNRTKILFFFGNGSRDVIVICLSREVAVIKRKAVKTVHVL